MRRFGNHHRPVPARLAATLLLLTAAAALPGCPPVVPTGSSLAQSELVPLASMNPAEAALGSGAPTLANSVWAIRKTDDDTLVFRIAFGSQGEVTRIFDSFVFGAPWLGDEIIPDTVPHSTVFVGGQYESGAYVAEQGNVVGVLGVLHGSVLGIHIGTATLSFSGSLVNDRIDGAMSRTVTAIDDTPFPAPGDAEFAAYALREE